MSKPESENTRLWSARLGNFEDVVMEDRPELRAISGGDDVYRDARRVLEGWCAAKLALHKTAADGKETELGLKAEFVPLCKTPQQHVEATKHLIEVLNGLVSSEGGARIRREYLKMPREEGGGFRCRFYLIPKDQSRGVALQKKLAEYEPELQTALQEACHMPDDRVQSRAH